MRSTIRSQSHRRINRRRFLGSGLPALSLLALPRWMPAWAGGLPPSQRINVGLIGRGLMGSGHLRRLLGDRTVRLLAVCDPDRTRLEAGRQAAEEHYAAERTSGSYSGCLACADYRELLARSDIDAVLIATPDHWHTLQSMDAAKAGKDVYCEKPVSLTLREGRALAEAVNRYERVFQTGTQYRSISTVRHIVQFIRTGGLGQVKAVFALWNNLASFIQGGRFQPYAGVMDIERTGRSYVPLPFPLPGEAVPEGLDWDLWLGPAPTRPYNHLYHTNPSPGVVPWSFCEDFGVTSVTWHFSHSADVIQYALGMEKSGPVEIIHPGSGRYPTLTCRYANGTLLHLVDHWGMVKDLYHAVPPTARLAGNFGGVFVGERGWITTLSTGGPVEGGPEEIFGELKLKTRDVNIGDNDHHANWLNCIRTRQRPYCDQEIGHRSASVGHLALVACALGQSLNWDPAKEEFVGNPEANRLRSRAMREPWRM